MIDTSIHTKQINEVYDVPLSAITRPIVPVLQQEKVASIMKSLQADRVAVPPIDLLWVEGREGGQYYFSFGGCHRVAAHEKLNLPTIRAKLLKTNINDIRLFLGSSLFNDLK